MSHYEANKYEIDKSSSQTFLFKINMAKIIS